jgi:hypothetical protein
MRHFRFNITLLKIVASHPTLEIDLKQTAIVTCIAMPPADSTLTCLLYVPD